MKQSRSGSDDSFMGARLSSHRNRLRAVHDLCGGPVSGNEFRGREEKLFKAKGALASS
jgi:hypothetical protein